jgi:hypothetical protein
MRFTLTIDCDGAAFDDDSRDVEVARILKQLSTHLTISGDNTGRLFDTNGNYCGEWKFEEN